MAIFCLKIWSVRKKAVPLKPFSRLLQVSREIERKSLKNVMLKISHLQRKCKKVEKSCLKIWSVQKKAVPLHPISRSVKKHAQNQSDL